MASHGWLPPIPPEHGAKTLLLVAFATPLSIGIGAGTPEGVRFVPAYLLFVGIAAGTMLVRAAIRQGLLTNSADRHRYGSIAALEAMVHLGSVGGLMVLKGTKWGLLLLLPIGGVIEAWVTRDRRSKPVPKAGIGVLAIAITPILQTFGILTALSIVCAYLTSMFVLPAALILWDRVVANDTIGTGVPGPIAGDGGPGADRFEWIDEEAVGED